MKRAILGLLAGIGVVALAVGLLDWRQEVMAQHPYTQTAYAPPGPQPAPPAVTGGELIAVPSPMGDKGQLLTVIDPRQQTMGVYWIEAGSGKITLRSVRNIRYDLMMMDFNGDNPLPREIRAVGAKVTFMAQKYYNVAEAAKLLGVSPADINQMVLRRELYGYRDGSDWKFKTEDIDRAAAERGAGGAGDETSDNVLASEIELGQSDPGLSGTVIGADRGPANPDSDIHLASDVKLAGEKMGDEKKPASDLNLLESDLNLAGSHAGSGPKLSDTAAGASRFEDLDMTLDHDLALQESKPAGVPVPPAAKPAAGKPAAALGDSTVDISGKKLDDDDLVLGGSGAGSDISIGGDSGISLVDPGDSGLNLEAPLNLSKGEESLELGEDDLLGMASDAGSVSGLKSEDDFQLTPMEDLTDTDDSESGSQVIALDTEGEGDEAATMVGSGPHVAGLLDEDLGVEPGLAAMPAMSAATELGLAGPEDAMAAGGAGAAALPEAPYSIWNILSLVLVCLLLILVGMMMYELLRNMWGLNTPIKTNEFDAWLMDTILGWFEK